MRQLGIVSCVAFLLTPVLTLLMGSVAAQVMTSSNYQIESDSINTGGGFSTSSNYQLESTVGEQATGESASTDFAMRAGFQQMQESYLTISAVPSVTMSPSIPGVAGGTAYGSTSVTVTTDSLAGYELSIRSESSPAMQSGGNTIADYSPAGSNPDFSFTTGAADAHLGFSPEGADVVQRFLDSGSVCNEAAGSDTADRCWDGLSTSDSAIAEGSGANFPSGTETVIKFQVGVGGSVVQPPGTYTATTTITAVAI